MNKEEKYKKYINFLLEKNCHTIKHSHSNFLNHLVGTFNILKKWKQPENVCVAGMFHNIYGNQYFNPNLNVTRQEIINLIGNDAEELVYKFVNSNRSEINLTDDNDLIILNLANSLEQRKLFIVEDNLYDKKSCENIYDYFKSLNYNFDGFNLTDKSSKWDYHLNFKHPNEKTALELSDKLLKKHGLNKIFKMTRAYASANTYGFNGECHIDDGAKEYHEVVTIMYYLNNEWDIEYGGETIFLNDEKNEIMYSVIPKPARAVIFDGFIYHSPRSLNKFCKSLRIVLTFKYKLINM